MNIKLIREHSIIHLSRIVLPVIVVVAAEACTQFRQAKDKEKTIIKGSTENAEHVSKENTSTDKNQKNEGFEEQISDNKVKTILAEEAEKLVANKNCCKKEIEVDKQKVEETKSICRVEIFPKKY